MTKRPQHHNKEIEKAIKYGETMGWRYRAPGDSAHAWGRLLCPLNEREGCSMSVWSTPKNAQNHAKQIIKHIEKCTHKGESDA